MEHNILSVDIENELRTQSILSSGNHLLARLTYNSCLCLGIRPRTMGGVGEQSLKRVTTGLTMHTTELLKNYGIPYILLMGG